MVFTTKNFCQVEQIHSVKRLFFRIMLYHLCAQRVSFLQIKTRCQSCQIMSIAKQLHSKLRPKSFSFSFYLNCSGTKVTEHLFPSVKWQYIFLYLDINHMKIILNGKDVAFRSKRLRYFIMW
jgi:hypothetical protein